MENSIEKPGSNVRVLSRENPLRAGEARKRFLVSLMFERGTCRQYGARRIIPSLGEKFGIQIPYPVKI